MKVVVFHGIGEIRLDGFRDPRIKQSTDAISWTWCAAAPSTPCSCSRTTIRSDAIEAYEAFDHHRRGWTKVKLEAGALR